MPVRRIGSGFVRANDLVRALSDLGCQVTVFPVNGSTQNVARVFRDIPDTVEVMHDRAVDRFKELLQTGWITMTWFGSRVHTTSTDPTGTEQMAGPVDETAIVVMDTEAVAPVQEAQQATLKGETYDLEASVGASFRNSAICDVVVTVSEAEAKFLRDRGIGPVRVVGHMIEPRPTSRTFAQRAGILFVGAIHSVDSPNYDSLVWFADKVLPLIEQALGWETRAQYSRIYRSRGRSQPVRTASAHHRAGAVANLEPLYNSNRVFIAPTRFAAGTPYKVYEAASRGVPIVAADHLCDALGWTNKEEIMAAELDPQSFAAAVIALYQQDVLWRHLRDGALRRVRAENSRKGFVEAIERVLANPVRDPVVAE